MTEEERELLEMRAGFYHADEQPLAHEGRRTGSGAAGAVSAALLMIMLLIPWDSLSWESMAEDGEFALWLDAAGRAVGSVCLCSARVELSSPCELFGKSVFNMDNSGETGNNIHSEEADISEYSHEYDSQILGFGSRRMPSSADEELYMDELLPPPSAAPSEDEGEELPFEEAGDGKITQLTYGKQAGENFIDLPMGGQLRNATKLSNNEVYAECLKAVDFSIKLNAPEDEPQVLIMHTHTTESYESEIREFYESGHLSRTTDNSMNMTAVGEEMAQVLEDYGIRVLHDTTVHDYPSYNGSYDRSRETVSHLLEKYPSIKVVLDVHRDAIERENGEWIAPSAEIDGESSAQVMIICGCDDGTQENPVSMKNLRTAALFQQYMESTHKGLTRPVLFDYRHYNQDLTEGSLLIEVGGHANSIGQAKYAGRLAADAIAKALVSASEE